MQSSIGTIAVSILGSGAISALIGGILLSQSNKRIERLKASLERGLYVTKAHYDLELESFRHIWAALNDLRLKVRAFLARDKFKINTPDGETGDWYARAYPTVIKDFFAAHDTVVRAITENSPFYPAEIRKPAERTLEIDLAIIGRISNIDGTEMSEPWFAQFRELSVAIDKKVDEIEGLIRERLNALRIVS